MNYQKSVELAIALGYEEVPDKKGYKGRYFIKKEKIWIHDISALKSKLGLSSNSELISLGYDVDNYHRYKNHSNEMVVNELIQIYNAITHEAGEATYMCDGMWLLPDGTIEER